MTITTKKMDFKLLIGRKLNMLVPLVKSHKGDFRQLIAKVEDQGFLKVRINGKLMDIEAITDMIASPYISYDIDIVIARIHFTADSNSMNSFIRSLDDVKKYGDGSNELILEDNDTHEEFKYTLKK